MLYPFDEELYPPAPGDELSYASKVAVGYVRMKKQRVVLAGLARNVEPFLNATKERMEHLGRKFSDYRILIFENDSSDATVPLLSAWSRQNSRVNIVSQSLGDPQNQAIRCAQRAARMAHYRRECQRVVLDRWPEYDHVILIDTDLEGGWSVDGIANTYGHESWDFVGSYGIIYKRVWLNPNCHSHYDAWAYRVDAQFTPLATKYVNRLLFRRGEPMVPLYSCFGGLGIYAMDAYQHGVYSGDDIEHVGFHRSLREQGFGRQFMNPSQVVIYGRRHRRLDPWVQKSMKYAEKLGLISPVDWRFARGSHLARSSPVSNDVIPRRKAS